MNLTVTAFTHILLVLYASLVVWWRSRPVHTFLAPHGLLFQFQI